MMELLLLLYHKMPMVFEFPWNFKTIFGLIEMLAQAKILTMFRMLIPAGQITFPAIPMICL